MESQRVDSHAEAGAAQQAMVRWCRRSIVALVEATVCPWRVAEGDAYLTFRQWQPRRSAPEKRPADLLTARAVGNRRPLFGRSERRAAAGDRRKTGTVNAVRFSAVLPAAINKVEALPSRFGPQGWQRPDTKPRGYG